MRLIELLVGIAIPKVSYQESLNASGVLMSDLDGGIVIDILICFEKTTSHFDIFVPYITIGRRDRKLELFDKPQSKCSIFEVNYHTGEYFAECY